MKVIMQIRAENTPCPRISVKSKRKVAKVRFEVETLIQLLLDLLYENTLEMPISVAKERKNVLIVLGLFQ